MSSDNPFNDNPFAVGTTSVRVKEWKDGALCLNVVVVVVVYVCGTSWVGGSGRLGGRSVLVPGF